MCCKIQLLRENNCVFASFDLSQFSYIFNSKITIHTFLRLSISLLKRDGGYRYLNYIYEK